MDEIMLLPPFKKATMDWFLLYRISNLSVRTRNGLMEISPSLNPDQLYEAISQPGFNFINIRNIGVTSVEEFEGLINELTDFIQTLEIIGDRELNIKYVELVLLNFFNLPPVNIREQIESLFDENFKLKLFALLEYLIDTNAIFSERDKKIFQLYYTFHENEDLNSASISEEFDLTDERVRQIKVELEKNLQSHFSFVSNLPSNILIDYGIDSENQLHIIDDTFSGQINESEDVRFKNAFYGVILGVFIKNTHAVLGNNQVIVGESKGQIRFKNCYLIKRDITDNFRFTPFLKEIFLLKQKKIKKALFLDLRGHLIKYLSTDVSRIYLDDILSICKILILNELDSVADQYGYVKIDRNTRKSIPDYAQEVLEEISHPMTIEQLMNAINNKYPHTVASTDSLRSSLIKNKDKFIHFSRTSTYGLRNWEAEMDNVMGGTISDIVEKYLKRSQKPKHLTDIAKYVIKYRPETNISSLRPNLKLEKNHRFKFYSSQYVGLQSNTRRDRGFKVKKLNGSHFTLRQFEELRGWTYDKIVKYFVKKYDYDTKVVKYVLDKKIEEGVLNFSREKVLL